MEALSRGQIGTPSYPLNDSKGSGGVMRVAPIGLFFKGKEVFEIGMKSAAITHGHPTGYLTAGYFAMLISLLFEGEELKEAVKECLEELSAHKDSEESISVIKEAIRLFEDGINPEIAIPKLGEGWVAEEALAIAVYCSLMYQNDYRNGILVSVNHGGDSDTTGTITGAILGTIIGVHNIPLE